jgi:two-component system sporulation sensor kinase A
MTQVVDSMLFDFQQIVNNAPLAVYILDQNKMIVWSNNSGSELLDLPKEDILHRNVPQFIYPNLRKIFEKGIKNVLEKRVTLQPIEIKINKNSREIIDVEVMAMPHYVNEQVFVHTIIRDITNRKIREKRLHDSERLSSLGQMTAGIIHEIKNPLTVVSGFLQLAKESYSSFYMETAETELKRALDTIQNLLQVSKPDLLDEPQIPINVSKELTDLVPLFQDKMYSIQLEMDIKNAGVIINGKKNLFQKAFFNLIKNSIEAIQGNGKIKIEHYLQDGWVHIKLSDSGVGIPPDKLQTLGMPFYSTKATGTGLGLTQVYTTIHEHGGIIEVDSVVGEGTTFHIQLPAGYHGEE